MEKEVDSGFIYIIIRAEFLAAKQHVYKIGYTQRSPPHKRLWEYPYGSLFLALYRVTSCCQFEKILKDTLKKNKEIIWRKDIGFEYFEGDLQIIINTISKIYPLYKQH